MKIKVRTTFIGIYTTLFVVLALMSAAFAWVVNAGARLQNMNERGHRINAYAIELQNSDNALTEAVQHFVSTGDTV